MRLPLGGSRAWLRAQSVAGAATGAARRLLEQSPPGGHERWQRTNYAGRRVSLQGGPAAAVGLVAGAAAQGRVRTAVGLAAIGVVGAYDDLYGDSGTKGVRGHLGALRSGVVTSGTIKTVVVSAAGMVIARGEARSRGLGLLRDGALVAGAANVVNLFDLRPGRAFKVAAPAALLPGGGPIAGVAGALIADDLRGRMMLGDCGSNAVGAAVGAALVRDLPPTARWLALGAAAAITYASEHVSFSELIEQHPVLDRIDRAGRSW